MTKKTTKTSVVKEVVANDVVETIVAPNAKTNNKIIKDFNGFMAKHGLTPKSSVNDIMKVVFKEVGQEVHPAVLAQQIREFRPESKTTQSCISWYKTHYVVESNCFKSSRKSNVAEKQELIDKIKTQPKLESIFPMLPALSVRQLKSYAEQLNLV